MLLNPCGVGRTVLLRASAGGFYYFTSCLNAPVIPVWKKDFIYMLPINPIFGVLTNECPFVRNQKDRTK